MSLDILKEDIKNKKIRKLYLFYGPEEFLKRFYTDSIEKILLTDDLKALNRVVFEGKIEVNAIIDNCETMPVFSDRKVVIVRNSGLFKPQKKAGSEEKKSKPKKDDISDFLADLPPHVCLIFYENEVDKRVKVIDVIKKQGLVVEFAYQKPEELVRWVVKKLKASGKEIDMATAAQLVENSEQGMTEILNEVEKLTSYLGDKQRVTMQEIEKVCTKSIKSRVFDLTDAIAAKNTRKAMMLLNDMVILKEPIPKIMFMIARQFRQILQVKLLHESGASNGEIASKLGMMPFIVGKVIKQAESFPASDLKKAMETCLELDLAVKTGRLEDRIAAELLIIGFSR
jgi:DNA polymerase III, delta subunit